MKKKKVAHTDDDSEGEEEDEFLWHEYHFLRKLKYSLGRDNAAVLMKEFHRLGTHHYQLANGYIKPFVLFGICQDNYVKCAKALFKGKMVGFKVDPNAQFDYGVFPLHVAASNLCYDMIRLLLSHGADADVRTIGPIVPGGLLPLNIAVEHARSRDEVVEQVISLLKQQGFIVKNDDAALSIGSTDFPLDENYKMPSKRAVDILLIKSFHRRWNSAVESYGRLQD